MSTGGGSARRLRLGFVGAGWIGRQRMRAVARHPCVDPVAVVDLDPAARRQAAEDLPGMGSLTDLEELLDAGVDGVVIATPSALHASQAMLCLQRGTAVFCQKPLARDAAETGAVVDAARGADRLLAVDLSYRHLAASARARQAIARGDIGAPYAAELTFHNGYGPDKPWFLSRRQAGGGCLVDLGTHLVDLGLWLTGSRDAEVHSSRVLRRGRPMAATADPDDVEDLALALLTTDRGVTLRLACSWHLPIGCDCTFECTVYGTEGAVSIRNTDGSFYDFTARRHRGTQAETLIEPPDDWGPRAITAWAENLAAGTGFDSGAERLVTLARVLDDLYAAAA
jgi:predicted dehydrogenase